VDTLKRDWNPKLTLHDVLVTIRCLLVYPNPTSSLNEAAGKLLLEDYDRFAKHAKLMTEVHAPVTAALKSLVDETRSRPVEGEEQIPKTLASGGNGNTVPAKPVVSSPQHRHRRQPSKPCNNGTFVIRKIKRATSPQAKPTSPGVDSDSDSGKENVMRRPSSPTGIKRTRDENAELAKPEDNEKGALSNDIAEASGRKSPKLKEDTRITPNTPKDAAAKPKYATPKKLINTASMKKKPTAKIGLKRF
jgi:ubiquitin-conjugating enzyme E2 S